VHQKYKPRNPKIWTFDILKVF